MEGNRPNLRAPRKGRWFYSPFPWFIEINRFAEPFVPDPSFQTYTEWTANGARKWSGGKVLKKSQACPERFGRNVQSLFELRAETMQKWASA
eukprot:2757467-Pyramimonas_sp.AAC.1